MEKTPALNNRQLFELMKHIEKYKQRHPGNMIDWPAIKKSLEGVVPKECNLMEKYKSLRKKGIFTLAKLQEYFLVPANEQGRWIRENLRKRGIEEAKAKGIDKPLLASETLSKDFWEHEAILNKAQKQGGSFGPTMSTSSNVAQSLSSNITSQTVHSFGNVIADRYKRKDTTGFSHTRRSSNYAQVLADVQLCLPYITVYTLVSESFENYLGIRSRLTEQKDVLSILLDAVSGMDRVDRSDRFLAKKWDENYRSVVADEMMHLTTLFGDTFDRTRGVSSSAVGLDNSSLQWKDTTAREIMVEMGEGSTRDGTNSKAMPMDERGNTQLFTMEKDPFVSIAGNSIYASEPSTSTATLLGSAIGTQNPFAKSGSKQPEVACGISRIFRTLNAPNTQEIHMANKYCNTKSQATDDQPELTNVLLDKRPNENVTHRSSNPSSAQTRKADSGFLARKHFAMTAASSDVCNSTESSRPEEEVGRRPPIAAQADVAVSTHHDATLRRRDRSTHSGNATSRSVYRRERVVLVNGCSELMSRVAAFEVGRQLNIEEWRVVFAYANTNDINLRGLSSSGWKELLVMAGIKCCNSGETTRIQFFSLALPNLDQIFEGDFPSIMLKDCSLSTCMTIYNSLSDISCKHILAVIKKLIVTRVLSCERFDQEGWFRNFVSNMLEMSHEVLRVSYQDYNNVKNEILEELVSHVSKMN